MTTPEADQRAGANASQWRPIRNRKGSVLRVKLIHNPAGHGILMTVADARVQGFDAWGMRRKRFERRPDGSWGRPFREWLWDQANFLAECGLEQILLASAYRASEDDQYAEHARRKERECRLLVQTIGLFCRQGTLTITGTDKKIRPDLWDTAPKWLIEWRSGK